MELRVVTSISHLCMKFPTDEGVGLVRGEQKVARTCYNASLKGLLGETILGEKAKVDGK
jgi:hypothetical protein